MAPPVDCSTSGEIAVPGTSEVPTPCWREPVRNQWRAWLSGWLGWMLDALDLSTFRFGRRAPLMIAIAWFAVAGAACVSHSANRLAVGPGRLTSPLLTETEISSLDPPTALDAIRRLRPHYLRTTRVNGEACDPRVYLDGLRLVGGIDALRDIPATTVHEIRRLDALDATTRYGTGHQGGAIVITTKRGH